MATSGSLKTNSYDGRYYIVEWTASQSVAKNTSTISWTLKAAGGNSSWYAERTLKVVLGGSTVYSKTERVSRYAGTIASGTKTITHNSSGDASFSISVQAACYTSSINCTASKNFTLNNIPRKSTLSVGNGTLGTAQTLTVTRKSSSFTHTIVAVCGSASSTVCSKSSSTSINFTPPISWASQNTTGTIVSVKYTITTFNGDTSVGSNEYSKTCSIPSSAKPSCSISVSDDKGYLSTYGKYIKGKSKLKVTITPTLSYGSPIDEYSISANGSTYSESTFTTGVLKSYGTLTISAKVTDKRNRSGTDTEDIDVYDYTAPKITDLTAVRCNSSGTKSSTGDHIKVTFKAAITSLDNKNSATYKIKYKKTTSTSWTTVSLTSEHYGSNKYNVTAGTYIFAADTDASYNISLVADDAVSNAVPKNIIGQSVSKFWSVFPKGKGFAFGKMAELSDVFDVGWRSFFRKHVCIGNKGNTNSGYYDGQTGVHINSAGFIHIQRDVTSGESYYPYIGFLINNETNTNSDGSSRPTPQIRRNSTNGCIELRNAGGYRFDNPVQIGNKAAYQDGKTGVLIDNNGWINIQRSDGAPYIGLYLNNEAESSGTIRVNTDDKFMEFLSADGYRFHNTVEFNYSLRFGVSSPSTSYSIITVWKDNNRHNIIERYADGLTSAFGWSGSADYATVTRIRGRTCQCQNSSGTTTLSDERLKKEFTSLDKWDSFFDSLEPCAFKMKNGTSGRYHLGFKAQQVEQALLDNGLTTTDFAGFIKLKYQPDQDDPDGCAVYDSAGIKAGDDELGLIYTEFVAMNTYEIQKLKERISELERRIG